jgi:hypothetical protein
MKHTLITLFLLTMSASVLADGGRRMRVLEEGRELRGEVMRLPNAEGGVVEIKACNTCPQLSLTLAPEAEFRIGRTQVVLNELRAHLNANPTASVLVVSPINSQLVTRIVAGPAVK